MFMLLMTMGDHNLPKPLPFPHSALRFVSSQCVNVETSNLV